VIRIFAGCPSGAGGEPHWQGIQLGEVAFPVYDGGALTVNSSLLSVLLHD
jgi:hypothetical protein